MSDGLEFDFSDLTSLVADLGQAPGRAARNIIKAFHVTSRKIDQDWTAGADRTGLGSYAGDVSYDITAADTVIKSEIGPTPGDAGSLGIMEDAPGGVRSAPQHAGRDATRKNEADFIIGIAKALEDTL